jgi:ribonuclease P protein component
MHAAPKAVSAWLSKLCFLLAHLVSKAQFDAVFAGRIIAKSSHFALHYIVAPSLAVGVTNPKRWARRAVTRNTIKRQVYAVSEALAPQLNSGHYVVRLRAEFSRAQFVSASSDALKRAVRTELQALLQKAAP